MTPGVGLGGQKPPGLPVEITPEQLRALSSEGSRALAYGLREVSRTILDPHGDWFRGLTTCGYPLKEDEWVPIYLTADGEARRAWAAGLRTCGSSWACPVCSPAVAEDRAEALERVVARLWALGWRVAHVVFTVRHTRGESLAEVFGALSQAWRRVISHRRVKALLSGWEWHRGVEITWGANGWHPHIHLLLLAPPWADPHALEEPLWEAWREAVEAVGWAPSSRGAYVYQVPDEEADVVAVARYQEKWGLTHEAAGGPLKKEGGGLTPWELLGVAGVEVLEGEEGVPLILREFCGHALQDASRRNLTPEHAAILWIEYVQETKGRKRSTASRNLQALLRAELEALEQERAQARLLEIVHLKRDVYLHLLHRMRLAQLLHWAEVLGSVAAACELMGLVPGEEWWVVLTPQGPPDQAVA